MTERKVEPLEHEELLAPKRSYNRILLPEEIPLHPDVFNSEFAYTPEFIKEVMKNMPDSINRDGLEVQRILGLELGIIADETGVRYKNPDLGDNVDYDTLRIVANPVKRSIVASYGSANIAIDFREEQRIVHRVYPPKRHPMTAERLREYAFSQEGEIVNNVFWYVHNIHDHRVPLEMFFRNFAILFNNLGLEKLQGGKN